MADSWSGTVWLFSGFESEYNLDTSDGQVARRIEPGVKTQRFVKSWLKLA